MFEHFLHVEEFYISIDNLFGGQSIDSAKDNLIIPFILEIDFINTVGNSSSQSFNSEVFQIIGTSRKEECIESFSVIITDNPSSYDSEPT